MFPSRFSFIARISANEDGYLQARTCSQHEASGSLEPSQQPCKVDVMAPTTEEDRGAQTGKASSLRPLSLSVKDSSLDASQAAAAHSHPQLGYPARHAAATQHTCVSLLFCSPFPWQRILPFQSPPCQDPQASHCNLKTPVSPKMGCGSLPPSTILQPH